VRIEIGVGLGASCLLGCSGGVLDVGSSDAGDPRDATLAVSPAVTEFSAAAVERAQKLCWLPEAGLPSGVYDASDLGSRLTGGWLLCYKAAPAPALARSLQFMKDGHWYTLGDNGDGRYVRVNLGDEAGPLGSEGTYTFLDSNAKPVAPDGSIDFVAGNGMLWFNPVFDVKGAGHVMTMYFVAHPPEKATCVRIGP
jgi:hypothetical protein